MDSDWQQLQDHAWRYFTIHADQRLKAFNFYLIVATVLLGGGLTALGDGVLPKPAAATAFFALILLSFVFWKLDQRTSQLVKHGEAALKYIEARLPAPLGEGAPLLKIFSFEESTTDRLRVKQTWYAPWRRTLSYSDCFELIFATMASIGAVLGLLTVTRVLH